MSKIAVVYWSGTGNTEQMASAVLEGAKEKGADAVLFTSSEFDAAMMEQYDAVAWLPCYGGRSAGGRRIPAQCLCLAEERFPGKKIALFGSYGWGDGEWMRSWEETCRNAGAELACDSVICNEAPDDEVLKQCRELGAALN